MRLLDAETSHNVGLLAARWGLLPRETRPDPPSLHTTVWGRKFPNPLGKLLAAAVVAHAASQLPCSHALV